MINRVTHQTVQRSTLANLQQNLGTMAKLQAQMSSGKKINAPSDDPAATADLLRLRGEQRAETQYARNAEDATSWLATIDGALTSSAATLRRVRDLVVQGGDGALGPVSREALAAEIEGLRDGLLEQANTTFLGRNVFAGTSDAPASFGPGYTFTGATTDAPVVRQLSGNTTVRVDSDGAAVFGTGAGSVFQLLDDIVTSLRGTGDVPSHLTALDARMDTVLMELSSVGARQNRVSSAQEALADAQLTTKTQLGAIEDIDLAGVILELQMQEVAYQGALGAAGKVLQPTLMEFLR
ncbi:flagellar hook-associated protein FlgL [Cellulomonas cellasea]|uniref:Flagellar hook-associated protein 3 FlgL n=1 Tax=Cellulomonas cellasea TaxID=43670 RepID=A0A7W4UHF1_9CELL|nr:flagellar hook-associated protein FlgL [Cellulomonas cellasea]MBB2924222.1 flagellar hook-associated protein 3 FlgL [Cellulomonas cellasea]